jgi:septal ring factor EnvC (AmiA/AmiB activator)
MRSKGGRVEERIINALLEIKGTLVSHSKSLSELRDGQNRIEGKIYGLEDDITDMKNDVVEIKSTVNALSAGLLDTAQEVKKLKGQK